MLTRREGGFADFGENSGIVENYWCTLVVLDICVYKPGFFHWRFPPVFRKKNGLAGVFNFSAFPLCLFSGFFKVVFNKLWITCVDFISFQHAVDFDVDNLLFQWEKY